MIWKIQLRNGSVISDQVCNWMQINEPIKSARFLLYPVEDMDSYFFVVHAIGSFGGASRTDGITFGGVRNNTVHEYSTVGAVTGFNYRTYHIDQFRYDRKILKKGIRLNS